jgi:hypothetical protein
MSKTRNALPTIDLATLDEVTGGRRRSTSSSSSNVDMQLIDSLNDIENALNNLANNGNKGNSDLMQTMMMMSMMNQPQTAAPVPQAPTIICNKRGRCW